ncbi:MAG TPA: hypothetical protein VHD63_14905 [Ktedonobacteraceae bacterium]|nr:hypothetical protein [Ktedonobacteraceae bacterium]
MAKTSSDKILARLKGLRARMREGEQPLFSIPAIWENATDHQSNACDLVLTNQRLFGYIYTTFPRERLFLDALELTDITAVSIRQKSFEAVFRELLVSDPRKRVYIRATSKKIEETYSALRAAIADYAPRAGALASASQETAHPGASSDEPAATSADAARQEPATGQQQEFSSPSGGPSYSRQRLNQPLERSPLGITILLLGGLLLEIAGILSWFALNNPQAGIPLILAGLVAVIVATIARRQLR